MNVDEALVIVTRKFPDRSVISGYDYSSMFVFNTVKNGEKSTTGMKMKFDTAYAVDKVTREVTGFNPMHMPPNEYKNGRQVL